MTSASDQFRLLSKIIIGTKLNIFWPDDNKFYPCIVNAHRPNAGSDKGHVYVLHYDDGEIETIDLSTEWFRIIGGKQNMIPEDVNAELGDDDYHHDESDDDDFDDAADGASNDDSVDEIEITHTGKSVVQEMLSLGCFELMPIIRSIGGDGVPAEEVKNMELYQQESWRRTGQNERKMATNNRKCFYLAFAVERKKKVEYCGWKVRTFKDDGPSC